MLVWTSRTQAFLNFEHSGKKRIATEISETLGDYLGESRDERGVFSWYILFDARALLYPTILSLCTSTWHSSDMETRWKTCFISRLGRCSLTIILAMQTLPLNGSWFHIRLRRALPSNLLQVFTLQCQTYCASTLVLMALYLNVLN